MSHQNNDHFPGIVPAHMLTYCGKYSSPYPDAVSYKCYGIYNPLNVTSIEYYPDTDRYAMYFVTGKYLFMRARDFKAYRAWADANLDEMGRAVQNGAFVGKMVTSATV